MPNVSTIDVLYCAVSKWLKVLCSNQYFFSTTESSPRWG